MRKVMKEYKDKNQHKNVVISESDLNRIIKEVMEDKLGHKGPEDVIRTAVKSILSISPVVERASRKLGGYVSNERDSAIMDIYYSIKKLKELYYKSDKSMGF